MNKSILQVIALIDDVISCVKWYPLYDPSHFQLLVKKNRSHKNV